MVVVVAPNIQYMENNVVEEPDTTKICKTIDEEEKVNWKRRRWCTVE